MNRERINLNQFIQNHSQTQRYRLGYQEFRRDRKVNRILLLCINLFRMRLYRTCFSFSNIHSLQRWRLLDLVPDERGIVWVCSSIQPHVEFCWIIPMLFTFQDFCDIAGWMWSIRVRSETGFKAYIPNGTQNKTTINTINITRGVLHNATTPKYPKFDFYDRENIRYSCSNISIRPRIAYCQWVLVINLFP